MIQGHGAPAFVHNFRAAQTFPLDWLARHQLGLTLSYLALSDSKSVIEPQAADRIFEISRSASPWSPSTLVARINVLAISGRLHERRAEVEGHLGYLRRHARKQASVWTAEAMVAAQLSEPERAVDAINSGLRLSSPQDPALEDIKSMARAIAPREAE